MNFGTSLSIQKPYQAKFNQINLKFGTKNTGEIRRDNKITIHFKETGWEVVCSNSHI
jgi:hypothetical protein